MQKKVENAENVGKYMEIVENVRKMWKSVEKCMNIWKTVGKSGKKVENVEKSCLRRFVAPYGLEVSRILEASEGVKRRGGQTYTPHTWIRSARPAKAMRKRTPKPTGRPTGAPRRP